jgi:uncharacterized protein (DUF305 family)
MPTAFRTTSLCLSTAAILALAACGSSTSTTAGGSASTTTGGSSSTTAGGSGSTSMGSMSTAPGTSASSTATHKGADVTFATDMIPHHGQAILMADMALTDATSAQVKKLATQIKAAQDPEITTMSGWLKQWGAPVPSTSMSAGSMGGMSMNGMMSAAEMAKLGSASGTAFDKLWVQMMIKHHRGALEMAGAELSAGQDTAAKALAQSINDSQSKQIATMQALLGTL